MSSPRMTLPTLIPESAPFSAEQRVWLNGLFAGLLALEPGVTPLSLEQAAAMFPGGLDLAGPAQGSAAEEDDDAPWHDPAMELSDRMKLAEGRPLRRRLMAAMGQQDCGQCGYNCQDYSDAIYSQKEERLNLCVPGGKETTRMLKALHQELGSSPPPQPAKAPTQRSRLPLLRLHRPPRPDVRARTRPRPAFFLALVSISRAPPRKPGISNSI